MVEIPPVNAGNMGSTSDQEDPTCRRATDPVHTTIEPVLLRAKELELLSPVPQLLEAWAL